MQRNIIIRLYAESCCIVHNLVVCTIQTLTEMKVKQISQERCDSRETKIYLRLNRVDRCLYQSSFSSLMDGSILSHKLRGMRMRTVQRAR